MFADLLLWSEENFSPGDEKGSVTPSIASFIHKQGRFYFGLEFSKGFLELATKEAHWAIFPSSDHFRKLKCLLKMVFKVTLPFHGLSKCLLPSYLVWSFMYLKMWILNCERKIRCALSFYVNMPHAAAAAVKLLQSCPTLCDPIDSSPPGSAVPGILQARTLEWVVISFSNAWKWKVKVKSLSHVRLSGPMDWSLPGSSIHGIFQARVLEWGAIAFSYLRLLLLLLSRFSRVSLCGTP